MKKTIIFILNVLLAFSYNGCRLQNQQASVEFQYMFDNNFGIILDDAMKTQNISREDREIFVDIIKKATEEIILESMTVDEIKEVNSIFLSPKFQEVVIKVVKGNTLTQEEKDFLSNIQQASKGFQKITSKKLQQKIINNIGEKLEQYRLEKLSAIQ